MFGQAGQPLFIRHGVCGGGRRRIVVHATSTPGPHKTPMCVVLESGKS